MIGNLHEMSAGRLTAGFAILLAALAPSMRACMAQAQSRTAAKKKPVYVTASFVDKKGLFIENLQKSEVEILENNQPREIEFMARDELPTVYGIVFDRAMLPDREDTERPGQQEVPVNVAARDIAYQLVDKLLGRQALWAGVYDRQLNVVFETASDGFGAKNAIHQMRGTRGPGDSFLYSALFSGVERMSERHERRRVIILFIQDLDAGTASRLKPLKNLLATSDVELFTICFARRFSGAGAMSNAATTSSLKELTQVTAGNAYFSIDYRDHFEDLVRHLLDQIRTLYTFGFTSQSGGIDPARLLIKCSRPNSKVRFHPSVPDLN